MAYRCFIKHNGSIFCQPHTLGRENDRRSTRSDSGWNRSDRDRTRSDSSRRDYYKNRRRRQRKRDSGWKSVAGCPSRLPPPHHRLHAGPLGAHPPLLPPPRSRRLLRLRPRQGGSRFRRRRHLKRRQLPGPTQQCLDPRHKFSNGGWKLS